MTTCIVQEQDGAARADPEDGRQQPEVDLHQALRCRELQGPHRLPLWLQRTGQSSVTVPAAGRMLRGCRAARCSRQERLLDKTPPLPAEGCSARRKIVMTEIQTPSSLIPSQMQWYDRVTYHKWRTDRRSALLIVAGL